MKEFIKNLFSADEKKTSTLVVIFLLFSLVAIVEYILKGDITTNVVDILKCFCYVIGGVNVLPMATNLINRVTTTSDSADNGSNI